MDARLKLSLSVERVTVSCPSIAGLITQDLEID